MNATPLPSAAPAPTGRVVAAALGLAGIAAATVVLPVPAQAAVYADVVSSTAVTAYVPVQRRECGTVEQRGADAGTFDPNSQPIGDAGGSATRCRTVTVRTQRVVGYDVVYEIAGARQTVRLDRDPGPRVELGVVAQATTPAARPVGQMVGTPVERPIGRPVPAVVDDGGPVAPAPTYSYGEQRPIGVPVPASTTTVIVERPYGAYDYGPYSYGYAYSYPWFVGPSIGLNFWGGGRWGGGGRHWDGGRRGRR